MCRSAAHRHRERHVPQYRDLHQRVARLKQRELEFKQRVEAQAKSQAAQQAAAAAAAAAAAGAADDDEEEDYDALLDWRAKGI